MSEIDSTQQKNNGDEIEVERRDDVVRLRRAVTVAECTSGILAAYRKPAPLTVEEERVAFEEAVAEQVLYEGC